MNERDEYWMRKAMKLARFAQSKGEIPVGAILVQNDKLIASGCNLSITLNDPSAHAEMIAIRRAGQKLNNYRIVNTTLYVTLEPCPMCAGLLVHSRISRLVFGASDLKTGAAGSVMDICNHAVLNHQIDVEPDVLKDDCSQLISMFFRKRREEKKNKRAK